MPIRPHTTRNAAQSRALAGAAALAAPLGCARTGSARMANRRKPNIIFILADDLGYGDLGCYGQDVIATPCIDRMAAEGVRFTQCYAGSTVCAPSRCCLMTGMHTGHAQRPRQPTRPAAPRGHHRRRDAERRRLHDGPHRQMGIGRTRHDGDPEPQRLRLLLRLSQSRQRPQLLPGIPLAQRTQVPLEGTWWIRIIRGWPSNEPSTPTTCSPKTASGL